MEFKEFYDTTYKNLFKFLYYKGLSKEETEDQIHSVYVKFLTGYKSFLEQENDLDKYTKILYGIAKNVWSDYIREKIAYKEKFLEIEEIEDCIGEVDEEIEIINNDSKCNEIEKAKVKSEKSLLLALKSLSPLVKLVIELKYLKNYTRKEIAVELNISEDTVHTYQKRGIKYLKEMLI